MNHYKFTKKSLVQEYIEVVLEFFKKEKFLSWFIVTITQFTKGACIGYVFSNYIELNALQILSIIVPIMIMSIIIELLVTWGIFVLYKKYYCMDIKNFKDSILPMVYHSNLNKK